MKRLATLTVYTIFELAMQPAFKVTPVVAVLWAIFLGFVPRIPDPNLLRSILFMLLLLYGSIASANTVVQRLQRGAVELYLSKPFSRADLILATYLGVTILVASVFLMFGLTWLLIWWERTGTWNGGIVSTCASLVVGFASMYGFIAAGGIIFRHTPFVTLLSTLYILFGATILEIRSFDFMNINAQQTPDRFLQILYYALPPLIAIQKSLGTAIAGGAIDPYPVIHAGAVAVFALTAGILYLQREDL
ncbi:MAG TPA: hypothetical protein VMM57_06415 [Bacteroidota bacterium]|nr:hypothetical protein [Bacteroidota bacterium]